MVAVLTVVANHLFHWPHGGFVGVDVFFVISGFLITGNLLRSAEKTGTVSFKNFYWNRVRRIVPAATVVLILTYLAALFVFLPSRAHQVGIDAIFAFGFMANWHFAFRDTDYFAASDQVSPIQHYWSLSIEEQFYFVWPALIFLISAYVVRRALTHQRRMLLVGAVMALIIALSLGWAIYETSTAPTWAYFNTFARVWELGVGALLATAVGLLTRIPDNIRPLMSWAGLGLIAASLFLITDTSVGFPAPWGLLPVTGAALVIAAGVGNAPRHQQFLTNRVSTYIGDISYSLYLTHWPVIVILAVLMDRSIYFYVCAIALTFGLAIASYHFVENPLRRADWSNIGTTLRREKSPRGGRGRSRVTAYAGIGSLALTIIALAAYVVRPIAISIPPPAAVSDAAQVDPLGTDLQLGPLGTALRGEIDAALSATSWPTLDPSMEAVIGDDSVRREGILGCAVNAPLTDAAKCTFGSPSAPIRAVILGDSVAANYTVPLREMAQQPGGQMQFYSLTLGGCQFINDLIFTGDPGRLDACPGRKQAALDYINTTKPDIVFIAHNYAPKRLNGTNRTLTPAEWSASLNGRHLWDSTSTSSAIAPRKSFCWRHGPAKMSRSASAIPSGTVRRPTASATRPISGSLWLRLIRISRSPPVLSGLIRGRGFAATAIVLVSSETHRRNSMTHMQYLLTV